ncbi:MAG TPA: VOC family protein [Candidatus Acidoferrales bacterium]|nr:VOC family protein [Candidatus Acidoferrales bacterium]
MQDTITKLVEGYEGGRLTRRELIAGLTVLATAPARALASPQLPGAEAVTVNHIAVTVSDIRRSIGWYKEMFGLTAIEEKKEVAVLVLPQAGIRGPRFIFRPGPRPGVITHFMLGVDQFNAGALAADLKRHGLDPRKDFSSYHVKDPDGLDVQVGDKNMQPEKLG